MVEYSNVNVKLSDATNLRMSLKMFNGNDISYKLLLTTRQKNKTKKCF